MRFMPTRRNDFDLFDDVFNAPMFGGEHVMRTDISKKDGNYVLDVEMPGVKKEDIKISLYNGNLNISAEKNTSKEEKDEHGNIIHQERFSGTCSRSFYVGNSIHESDIKASFKDGVLTLTVPDEETKEVEQTKYISLD